MANEAQTDVAQQEGALSELDEFSDILRQTIKPRSDAAAKEVDNALTALVGEAMADQTVIEEDVIDTINGILAKLDKKLSDQVNEIIHHDDFQALESSWRGLAYTVNNAETGANLRVKVFNASK
ncbi:MAG: type VI secretion system contractile sheath large subunit, partial [Pseudomonadota bacterium]